MQVNRYEVHAPIVLVTIVTRSNTLILDVHFRIKIEKNSQLDKPSGSIGKI